MIEVGSRGQSELYVRFTRVFVAAFIALAGFASPVAANHQATPFHSTSRSTLYICCATRHEVYDSFRMRANMSWTSFPAGYQRLNQTNGIFFTMDQHDLSHNVEAYTYATSIPNPYFDTDDDNADYKNDEGEIVSESTTFPATGVTYTSSIYWSHWYTAFPPYFYWAYDQDGGTVEFDENLSMTSCPIVCDKYDTHGDNTNVNWNLNKAYPANAQGQAAVESGDQSSALSRSAGKGPPPGRSYRVAFGDDPSEVSLRADLSQGLATYARNARVLAEATIIGGAAEGVATFNYPLTWDELAKLEAAGLVVHGIEVITAPDRDHLRWTIFVENEPDRAQLVDRAAIDEGVEVLGIVAAYVTVPNQGTLDRVQKSKAVYLVDLSITDYHRHNPGVIEVGQNDVYWLLAGWN